MTQGTARKRYLLFSSDGPVDGETQKEFTRLILERYPKMKKGVIWFEGSLIVKTNHFQVAEMERSLALTVGDKSLVPARVSGSISKLKRLVLR